MPKKRNIFQYTKPSSPVHPSLSSSAKKDGARSILSSSPSGSTVNEKLQQLRLEQKFAAGSTSVTTLLPTPAYTASPSNVRRPVETPERDHGRDIEVLPGSNTPEKGTLLDQTFRALAQNWDWHMHYDQFYLATLPVRHKEVLLQYIARYSQNGIDAGGLEMLFYDAGQLEDATAAEGLTHLDVSASISQSLTFKGLKRFFTMGIKSAQEDVEKLPDSWEALPRVSDVLSLPKFHCLTHLSLSHPSSANWKDLLDFAPHLTSLTHLSLAYWPIPRLTPNSTTAFTSTPSGNVSYGASNFYSEYDNDWSEPASILRRLSKHTLCLRWLNLTGCYPWIQCLSYPDIPWCGAWAGLSTIKIGQGYLPSCLRQPNETSRIGETVQSVTTRAPHSLESSTNLDVYSLTSTDLEEITTWTAQEKCLQKVEKDVRARIKSTLSESPPPSRSQSAPQGHSQDAIMQPSSSDDWVGRNHHQHYNNPIIAAAKAGTRSGRLVFDYGWDDPRIKEAIECAQRQGYIVP